MPVMTPADVRSHMAALAAAGVHEIQELRAAPVELKLRQLWTLMSSAHLFEDPAWREAGVKLVRDRWLALHRAMNV